MMTARVHLDGRKWASIALIPFALILIILFTVLDIRIATEPPFLLAVLNTTFIGIIPLVIAAIAFRSYRTGGSAGLFMMGSGMMIFGLGSIAAGWLIGLPGGANISVTIYNVCILLSAVFYLTGAVLTFIRSKTPETSGDSWKIAAAAAGIIIFVAAFIILAIAGSIPPFFIAGSGPTVLRQVILSNAIVILAIASILLFHIYRQKREDFFFWYSVSLAVIAVGLDAALFTPALGSPVNWVSRVMQYVGAGFALVAIIVAGRFARDQGHSLEETLSRFFSNAEAGYKSLIETATDAIVVFDADDRVIVWNRAAETMIGYSESEALGSSFTQLAVPDESAGIIKNNFRSHGIPGAGSAVQKPVGCMIRRKDGSAFPAEVSSSRHMVGRTEVSTSIIRDLTDRMRADEALHEREAELSFILKLNDALSQLEDPVQIQATAAQLVGEYLGADRVFYSEIVIEDGIEITVIKRDYHRPGVSSLTGRFPFKKFSHTDYENYRAGQTVSSPNVFTDGREPSQSEAYRMADTAAFIGVPLVKQGKLISVLGILQTQPRNWTPEEIRLAEQTVDRTWQAVQRARAEEALRESEIRFRLALKNTPVSVALQDTDLVYRWAYNQTTHRTDEIVGRTDADLFAPEDVAWLTPLKRRIIETGEDVHTANWLTSNGQRVYLDIFFEPLRDPAGLITGIGIAAVNLTGLKIAESALSESEERMRIALEAADLGTWSFDLATGIADHSPRHDQIFGYSEPVPEWSYEISIRHMLPEFHAVARGAVEEGLKTGVVSFEARVQWPDGSIHWINPFGRVQYNNHGKPVRIAGVVSDITERKKAEAQVRDSYKTFSDLIEGAPFGIYVVDSQSRIAMMNIGSQNNAFRNVRPLIGRYFPEAMHTLWPDDVAEEILGHFRHTLETGEPYYSPRFTNPRHDIEITESYEWELHRMTLPDGQFGVICYYFDSTKLRNAEEAVRLSEERLRLAREAGNVGIWDWDLLTTEVRWTPELEAIYGLKPGSVHTYQDFRDRVHPDDIGRVEKIQSDAVDRHKPFEYEFRFRRPEGEVGWVYCRGGARYNEEGRPVRQFGVNIDITERKNAEERIRNLFDEVQREKDRLSSLISSISDEVWFADMRKNFTLANPAALREFAIGSSEIDIEKFAASLEVYRPDGSLRPVEEAPPLRALKGEAVRNQEEMIKTPVKGEIRYRQVSANPVRDSSGTIIGSVSVVRDITTIRKAEDRISNLAAIVQNSDDGIIGETLDGTITSWNAGAEKIYGYSASEAIGRSISILVPPDKTDDIATVLGRIKRGESFVHYETRRIRKDGKIINVSLTMSPIRDSTEKLIGASTIARDITERKRTEQALRESEEKFHMIFERSPFGIAMCDLSGRLLATNSAFESMLGYTKEELANRHFAEFTDPGDIGTEQQIFSEGLTEGSVSHEFEKHYLHKDGRVIRARIIGTFIRGLGKAPSIGLAMVEDVTDKRQTEEALKRSLAEKEVLLSEIHHRVKNNLTAFISLLSLEGSVEDTVAGRDLKNDLQNRARSMALIHETLYKTHQFSEVDMDAYLTPLVDQVVNSYSSQQTIRILVEAKGVALDLARATPAGLIVNELVTNSLKHAFPKEAIACRADQKDPCTIRIRLTKENGSYQLSVYDNGIGMPAGFDPLTAKSLGLKLVNFLAKHQMRATIKINTEKGTEFVFRFRERDHGA
ncbi:MAG: PAS domain S-box protein [Methanoregulaceae archaeon]|nr:MAG: PAS domain S-box protein [Methanoregulaceae archaeon]